MSRWRQALAHHGLYALQLGLGLGFQILFARLFGASATSDAYFAGYVVHAFLATLPLFISELFMQHYHEAKARGKVAALWFYQSASTIALAVGFLLALVCVPLVPLIAAHAFPKFDPVTRVAFTEFTQVLLLSLVLNPLVMLNNAVLNAEMRFAVPFLTAVFAPAANLVVLLGFGDTHGLLPLAIAPTVGGIAAYTLQRTYLTKLRRSIRLPLRLRWRHPGLAALIRSSSSMRLGHLLYTLKDPLAAAFLAGLPTGTMSLYYYAQRLMTMVHGLASAPVLQVFMARVSGQLAGRRLRAASQETRATVLRLAGFYVALTLPIALVLPSLLDWLLGNRLTAGQLDTVFFLFLALVPAFLLQSIEAPFGGLVISMQRAGIVIGVNSLFLAILAAGLAWSQRVQPTAYALPLFLALAEISNLALYFHFCRRLGARRKRHREQR